LNENVILFFLARIRYIIMVYGSCQSLYNSNLKLDIIFITSHSKTKEEKENRIFNWQHTACR